MTETVSIGGEDLFNDPIFVKELMIAMFVNKIEGILKEKKISRMEFAKRLKKPLSFVTEMLKEKIQFNISQLSEIIVALEVTPEYFLEYKS